MKSLISLAFAETAFNAASRKVAKLFAFISDVKWIVCKVTVGPFGKRLLSQNFNHKSLGLASKHSIF